ncbi:serine/threonine-protein kinase [Streptomyces sp. GESEQ-35]|uniref:serine/threonine-protein kinase n=1 Tax=Streptomyces sp. GESEQ-35 TaxID=2812657 RepID=UPI001B3404CE|nr:serine/threonine-protein kinase [Streptomyces sp. GESEQ-35]
MPQQNTASPDAGAERLVAGRYRLLSVLGEGGMGTVWRARDEALHREVAVKEVRAPVGLAAAQVERMYTRLEREAWAAARISARGVVTVHDVATDDGRPWVVMEFVRGGSLADVIGSQGALTPREAARIGAEVLAALRAAHGAGVLHRDVKPANVLLADDGRVVLTDFGIATVEGDSALTMTGELVGSPEYLAPERALGRNPGPASDLWSLGALLYTAVQGRSPFRRTSPLSTLRAIVDDELPPPHRAGPLLSVIEGLMRKDPDDRMSADEAEQELRLAGADGTSGAGVATPSAPLSAVATDATEERPTAESPLGETAPTATAVAPAAPTAAAQANTAADLATPEAGTTAATDVSTATTDVSTTTAKAPALDPRSSFAAGPAAPASTRPAAPSPTPEAASALGNAKSPTASASPVSAPVPTAVPTPMPASAEPTPPTAIEPEDADASGPGPMRRSRRIGYLIAAGVVVVALLVGGLSYALGGDDDEGGKGADSPTGQAQDAASGQASSGSDTGEQPVSVSVTGGATTYVGDCPPADSQAPWFTATFTVSELPFQFSYRWVSTNGSVIDRQWRTLSFPDGGPLTHKETVRLSTYAQSGTLRSEMAVEIRSPFEAVSNSVPFSVTCASTTGG